MKSPDEKKEQDVYLRELGINSEATNEFDGKPTADLVEEQRRLDVEIKRLELDEKIEAMAGRKRKKEQKLSEFNMKNRQIAAELGRRASSQRICQHRKGGVTIPGTANPLPPEGGDSDMFSIIKHQMPGGEWVIFCSRCGAEWWPANKFTGQPETVIGGYSWRYMLAARTDNASSKSAVFNFEDRRTEADIEKDRWHPPVDDNGKEVPDTRALPIHGENEPPPAVRR